MGHCDNSKEIGGLFGNHIHRRIRVAADDMGHDRRIDDTQILDAMYPKFRINHCHVISAHFTAAGRVPGRGSGPPDEGFQISIASNGDARGDFQMANLFKSLQTVGCQYAGFSSFIFVEGLLFCAFRTSLNKSRDGRFRSVPTAPGARMTSRLTRAFSTLPRRKYSIPGLSCGNWGRITIENINIRHFVNLIWLSWPIVEG